ncbi:hypothetical protein SARC_01368 [Sphaeroforma arctica JP610]|uniref:Uncharacterized protein n=1 Tax=Sphaeroforma arctica JP610 TaxID=667725 RepID=A0A0L0GBV7_9EUKA|nr:hypothetical protein SARC_01368 [Sphaeroforma arctica JP610]KNC86497.1 hypothetical protein SARC_01368 [Sphaeroforma arctica JP610]|eukprot:XP_014160399.1 hypothetical protein SARC_01368 [Sphaeroforma arctica JP610]
MAGHFLRFRGFLKSLGPGEAGFVNACVGLTAFSLAFYRYQLDIQEQRERDAEQDAESTFYICHKVKPSATLQTMKRYRARLRNEAKELGLEQPINRDELTDEWLRRRNIGDPEAENINILRLRMKSLLRACVNFLTHHPEKVHYITGDSQDNPIGFNPITENEMRKILLYVEPLDQACCRNHPTCNWARDAPFEYNSLREVYKIPRDWPSTYQNEDDFGAKSTPEDDTNYIRISETVPSTRVAQKFHELETKRLEIERLEREVSILGRK